MTSEEQSFSPEEMRKAMGKMLIRILNTALLHVELIGLRTLRALQVLDLASYEEPPAGDDLDPAVLRDQQQGRRRALSDGPLLLYETEDDEPKQMIIELPELLLADERDVRQVALEYIEEMIANNPVVVTPNTARILKESRDALLFKASEDWRPAAIAVYDALNNDILIALQGIRQCLEYELVIQDGLNIYTPKVFHPSITSLDSIRLPIGNPEREHETLAKLLLETVAHASNLAELCESYLANLGFLPLAPPYSLATTVRKWLTSNPCADPWQEVWGWANAELSPISLYHACSVFVLFPELIPDGKLPDLWSKILSVIGGVNRKGGNYPEYELWALRRDLAQHYTFHLESRLPDNDGASIGCFAWWLAEQVTNLFPPDANAAKYYRENWVRPALDLSNSSWLAACAPIQRSFLRYVTLTAGSPWAVALLTLMGGHLNELGPTDQEEDVQVRFHEAMVSNMLFFLPLASVTPNDPTFAFECSFTDTVRKWTEFQTGVHRTELLELVAMSQTLGTRDGLCDALRELGDSGLPHQVATCIALNAMVYTDPTIAEPLWEVVSDAEWRESVLGGVNHQVQDLLIESLTMLLVANQDKWFSHLPHYIAELCEKEEDKERRQVLFFYTIHTSLASDTVSAIHRLLRGNQKAKFVEYVEEYRARIEALRSDYPPWVAGKLRGLMASLYVL